jgi:hypothetical protein
VTRQVVEAVPGVVLESVVLSLNEWVRSHGPEDEGDPDYWRDYKRSAVAALREAQTAGHEGG